VAVLGLALYKLGYRKDVYMADPAFLLGRLLSLVDTLHREYCKEVRGGDIPPQLLGNSLMSTMTNDPRRGLARMRERVRVYQGWAATRGSGLARWSLGEMGKISPDLAQSLPQRMNDADQAQFLLGYLARSEKTDKEATAEGAN
jgi:CRISPR-associated protein (Cas_Csd1)